MIVSTINWRW